MDTTERDRRVIDKSRILDRVLASEHPVFCGRHSREQAVLWVSSTRNHVALCANCIDRLYTELRIYFGDV